MSALPKNRVSLLLCLTSPAGASEWEFRELVERSYRPLFKVMLSLKIPLALSVPWGLAERWLHEGFEDLLDALVELKREGQIELVGTAAYHPILPLLPRQAISR